MLWENKNALLSRVWTPKAGDIETLPSPCETGSSYHSTAKQTSNQGAMEQAYLQSQHSGDRDRGCQQDPFRATQEDLMTSKQTPKIKSPDTFLFPGLEKHAEWTQRREVWYQVLRAGKGKGKPQSPNLSGKMPQLAWSMSTYNAEGSGFKSWCTLSNSGLRGHRGSYQNRLEKFGQRRRGSCHTVALSSPLATLVFPQYYPALLSRYLKLHPLLHHVNMSARALEQRPWVSAVLFCRTIHLSTLSTSWSWNRYSGQLSSLCGSEDLRDHPRLSRHISHAAYLALGIPLIFLPNFKVLKTTTQLTWHNPGCVMCG